MSTLLPRLPERRALSASPRLLALAALSGVSVLVLSSCAGGTVRLDTGAPSLPSLTSIGAIRDTAARTESASAARAKALAADASACPQCAEVLTSVAANSTARLEALGGVWDPWGGEVPKGAKNVPPVADAPLEVAEFASWLATTARRDLAAAADSEETSASDALVLASTALGRYRSALALSRVYGVSLDAESTAVSNLNDRLRSIAGEDSLALLGTWGLDPQAFASGSALPPLDLSAAKKLGESTELAETITSWDCAAQSLPRVQALTDSIPNASSSADSLFSRVDRALIAGAQDRRLVRCAFSDLDAAALGNGLIAADLHLLASDDTTVRLIGVRAALEDLISWTIGEDANAPALIGVSRS